MVLPTPMSKPNLLTSSARELSRLLEKSLLTSEELTEQYLDQIALHNRNGMNIRAIITVADRESVRQIARELDQERAVKGPRGPLHGIPVLIKAGGLLCLKRHMH